MRSPEGSQWAFLVKVVRVFVKDNVDLVTKGIWLHYSPLWEGSTEVAPAPCYSVSALCRTVLHCSMEPKRFSSTQQSTVEGEELVKVGKRGSSGSVLQESTVVVLQ